MPTVKLASSFVDDLEVFDGIGPSRSVRHVDQMRQHAGALNVAQELDAKAVAEMRAFNEPGHVGDDEGLLVRLLAHRDHAEIGLESGEGIVGDFGARGGDAGDERGLAGVGIADQAHVGEQLEFQTIAALLAGAAQLVLARGLVGAGGEVLVAAAAAAALGDDDALVGLAEVVDQFAGFLVEERGADGDLQDDGAAVQPGAVGAHAVLAALRLVLGVVAEVDERVVALAGLHERRRRHGRRPRPRARRGARTSRAGRPCSRCRRRRP